MLSQNPIPPTKQIKTKASLLEDLGFWISCIGRTGDRKARVGRRGENEEDAGVANGIAASGVQIQAHGRGAHQPLPPVEDQRPSFRRPGHPRSGRLQMGALGFAWYSFSPFFIFSFLDTLFVYVHLQIQFNSCSIISDWSFILL